MSHAPEKKKKNNFIWSKSVILVLRNTLLLFSVDFPQYLTSHWNYGSLYFSQIKMKEGE